MSVVARRACHWVQLEMSHVSREVVYAIDQQVSSKRNKNRCVGFPLAVDLILLEPLSRGFTISVAQPIWTPIT
jgi:hypothetical protein